LDERIEGLSTDIKALADQDPACERLMTVPGIGPIISSAMVAAIGNGAAPAHASLLTGLSRWLPWSSSSTRPRQRGTDLG
jgi:transposase